jgi:hypothetical protein
VPVVPLLALRFLVADEPLRFALSLVAAALVFALYARRFGPAFLRFFRDPVAAVENR